MIRILFVALGLLCLTSCNKKAADVLSKDTVVLDANYQAKIEHSRADRIANLTKPQGWLSVVGLYWLQPGVNTIGAAEDNTIVFPRTTTETIGAYQLTGDEVFFGKVEGVEVNSDGQEYLGGPVIIEYPPTVANHQSLYWYVIKRGDKYGLRVKDTLADHRMTFEGTDNFPLDPKYCVKATIRPAASQEEVSILDITGREQAYPVSAYLDFNIDGKAYSLIALDEGTDSYFVIFGDLTNNDSTYGGGRFLYPQKGEAGQQTILDFNLAVNPPCAFSDFATCPLPPQNNKLSLKILAGEKKYLSNR